MSSLMLRSVSKESVVIRASTRKRRIIETADLFPGSLDPAFKDLKTNKKNVARPETKFQIYEQVVDATIIEMVNSFTKDASLLCVTEEQIICFTEDHPKGLTRDNGILFLLQDDDENFFIVCLEIVLAAMQIGLKLTPFEICDDLFDCRLPVRFAFPKNN